MKFSRRQLLLGSAAMLLSVQYASAWTHGNGGIAIPTNVWMEAPDILAFYADDAPIIKGNTQTGVYSGVAYSDTTPTLVLNNATGNMEYAFVIGTAKTSVRFVDRPIPSYVNKVTLHNLSNYTISNGITATAIYFRDEVLDAGLNYVSSTQTYLTQFRHSVYLKLSSSLINGQTYTITNTASPAPFTAFTFTYNDKLMRAGSIKASQFGVRNTDTFKKIYLTSRIPGGPNNGTIDFAGIYGITTAKIIDATTKTTVATVNVNLRRSWNQMETGDFYSSGIDVADTSVGYAVTGISLANPARVTCVGHPFLTNDKVRFHGIAGMTQIEAIGPSSAWIAYTVTSDDADHFFINQNTTSGFSAFSSTPIFDTSLGGVSNVVYKCFNTNRAGANVYELDLSAFTTPGNYYAYIPGFGISDPFYVGTEAYAIAAGNLHQGFYNLRLGCDVNASSGWNRPLASVDGVNGTAIYLSTMVAPFSSECAAAITPSGGNTIPSGLGAFSNQGTFTLTGQSYSGGTITCTVSGSLGMSNGTLFNLYITGSTSGYNAGGANSQAQGTVTSSNTFTYTAANPGVSPAPTVGIVQTGFVTSTRATGYRAPTQDAGDNDDLSCDHLQFYQQLAWVFNNISNAPSRFTPFTVQLSTSLLDPTLYAGTNSLPPLFHEIVWYADNYRVLQDPNGQVPGGYGLGHYGSQIPNYPEPIQLYRGTDANGSLAGQIVMNFVYAADHWGTMQYAALAIQIAMICKGYSLPTLETTWYNSAVAAYNRAHDLITDITKRDIYYITQLDLPNKMGWTNAQYNSAMATLTARAVIQQHAAAGAFYRYLGHTAGQSPYGDLIEGKSLVIAPSIGAGSGGSGYAVGDLITLANGTLITGGAPAIVRVLTLSGSAVASVGIYFPGEYSVAPITPFTQASTTGSGTGFSFNNGTFGVTYDAVATDNPNTGAYDYAVTSGNNATVKAYLFAHGTGASAADSTFYTSTTTCFNLMISPSSSSGSNNPNLPLQNLIAHMMAAAQSLPNLNSSPLLQSMSAHIQWLMGANMVGKCMAARLGVRSVNSFLHEDYWKMGVSCPPGIVPLQFFAWAVGGGSAFQGAGTNTDGQVTYIADNTNGTHEGLAQPGSTKVWSNWRYGESYWEFGAENRGMNDNVCEYTLANLLITAAMALYCHGWDGNV